MSVMNQTATLPAAGYAWPKAALIAGLSLLAIFILYWPTFHSMLEIWERSETFAHGYLIFPISAWLIWRQRHHLAQIEPKPDWRGLVLLVLAGAGWLLADAGSVIVVAQYAFIALLIAAIWAVLGWHIVWALFFPFMFLFFAVPVGEFLIPPLIEFTANFTVSALQLTGIPVYREGTHFSIPSGDWSVVEACSGLRYLIASVTLGVLYAYLTYISWQRRLVFILFSIFVPILANGLRAYMIVMIGHLSGMKYAVGVDHLIYGWAFFGVVMLLLFWVGSYWREDDGDQIARPGNAMSSKSTSSAKLSRWSQMLPVVLLLSSTGPAYSWYLDQRNLPEWPAIELSTMNGWQPVEPIADWTPHWVGADRQLRTSYVQNGDRVMLALDYFGSQRQDAELINSQNYMVSQSRDERWLNVGENQITIDLAGEQRKIRQTLLKNNDPDSKRLLAWQWNVIDGKTVNNDHYAKLILALDRIIMMPDDGISIIVAAPYEVDQKEAATVLTRFIQDNESAILQAIDRVSAR